MTNIVAFRRPDTLAPGQNAARLLRTVATRRRDQGDVFWLKEVAELLGVWASIGQDLPPGALDPLEVFYDTLEARLRFYPQYYRFLLSICLDLEDLGMPGSKGAVLCDWVAAQGVSKAELSDLQRAEAGRLLARRGADAGPRQGDLAQRLHRFIARPQTFCLPNKKAGYELTHIVFYLSDYGRRDPELAAEAARSLIFVGLLAYLDQDIDLLAEVCIAQRFAGQRPPAIWEAAVTAGHRGVRFSDDATAPLNDGFHAYLVTGWAEGVAGRSGFDAPLPRGASRMAFDRPGAGALRAISECLFAMGDARSGDWPAMRCSVLAALDPHTHEVLYQAEQSVDCFDAFFDGFARAGTIAASEQFTRPMGLRLEGI